MCQSVVHRLCQIAAGVLLSFAVLCGPVAARDTPSPDYTEALAAYNEGQFQDALTRFHDLAQKGHGGAEFMLGVMYFYGRGVARDPSIASIWFYKSARQGNSAAQLAFGSMFIRGVGVSPNNSDAYKWLRLAEQSGVSEIVVKARELLGQTAERMSQSEISAAEQAASNFTPVVTGPSGME